MGLLDDWPDGLFKLIRNAAQNRNPSADLDADDAIDLPSGDAGASSATAAESRRTRSHGGHQHLSAKPKPVRRSAARAAAGTAPAKPDRAGVADERCARGRHRRGQGNP